MYLYIFMSFVNFWQALVGHDNERGDLMWHCGGTLISNTFVLTGGSCVLRWYVCDLVKL